MNKSTFIPGILAAMLVGSVATPALAGDPQTAINKHPHPGAREHGHAGR